MVINDDPHRESAIVTFPYAPYLPTATTPMRAAAAATAAVVAVYLAVSLPVAAWASSVAGALAHALAAALAVITAEDRESIGHALLRYEDYVTR